jgi:hypothetical protein
MMRFAVLCLFAVGSCTAFTLPSAPLRNIALQAELSRRDAVAFGLAAAGLVTNSPLAFGAGAAPPTKDDLNRIKVGYEGLVYLLENFDQETTVCRENGGECKRDAEPVRKYMGLRSTTDPLFQIEKVFNKVKNMDLDPDKLEPFFEATEDWNSAMNMSNSMAFISQFGVSIAPLWKLFVLFEVAYSQAHSICFLNRNTTRVVAKMRCSSIWRKPRSKLFWPRMRSRLLWKYWRFPRRKDSIDYSLHEWLPTNAAETLISYGSYWLNINMNFISLFKCVLSQRTASKPNSTKNSIADTWINDTAIFDST